MKPSVAPLAVRSAPPVIAPCQLPVEGGYRSCGAEGVLGQATTREAVTRAEDHVPDGEKYFGTGRANIRRGTTLQMAPLPSITRVVVWHGPNDLRLEERRLPEPGPRE